MTPVRPEPAAPRSRVKHSTTEPLRSLYIIVHVYLWNASSLYSVYRYLTYFSHALVWEYRA